MKSTVVRFSTILMMFGLFVVVSFGQNSERLKFDKGANSGTYTRTLPAQGSIDLVINAKKGQFMDYTVGYDFKKTDIEGILTEPNLQDISQTAKIDERNVFRINTSGDHRLTVNNMTRKSVTFTLYLQITNDDPDADDGSMNAGNSDGFERIDFGNSGDSGIDTYIELNVGETRQFVAFVKKGYTVCVNTDKQFGKNLMVEVEAVEIETCSENSTKAGDRNINFTNKGNRKIAFTATIKSFN